MYLNLLSKIITTAHAVDIGTEFKLGETGPAINSIGTLSDLIYPLIKDAFVIAGVVLVIFLIFGGITYIMNAGSGDKEGVEKSKNALTISIVGFIIIFIAYWLVQIVGFVTGVQIFNSTL